MPLIIPKHTSENFTRTAIEVIYGSKAHRPIPMGIHIELNSPKRSFIPGRDVIGRVVIYRRRPEQVKEVTITLEGKARVHCPDNSNGRRMESCSEEETYVLQTRSLASGEEGEQFITLPPGRTTYTFKFLLPPNIPSSFSSKYGEVYYVLKGQVRRSLFKPNDNINLSITVNRILDLNLVPNAGIPLSFHKTRESSWVAGRTGEIGFVLRLPTRRGYVPREVIDFRAEMTNRSNQRITGAVATLLQVSNYAWDATKATQALFSTSRKGKVEKEEFEVWDGLLVVPAVPPTGLGGDCGIIDIKYYVHFEIKISGISSSLSGMLPVTIGNIPLRSASEDLRPPTVDTTPVVSEMVNLSSQGQNRPRALSLTLPSSWVRPMPSLSAARSASLRNSLVEGDGCSIMSLPAYTDVVGDLTPNSQIDDPDMAPPSYVEAVGVGRMENRLGCPASESIPGQIRRGTREHGNVCQTVSDKFKLPN